MSYDAQQQQGDGNLPPYEVTDRFVGSINEGSPLIPLNPSANTTPLLIPPHEVIYSQTTAAAVMTPAEAAGDDDERTQQQRHDANQPNLNPSSKDPDEAQPPVSPLLTNALPVVVAASSSGVENNSSSPQQQQRTPSSKQQPSQGQSVGASKPKPPIVTLPQKQDIIHKAKIIASGSLLPLFTDKVRNNVRSRAILVGIYAVSTAFVCLLLVYAFSLSNAPQWEARFATKPPATIYIGEPMPTFSFEVLDTNTGKGVEGLSVFAFISPITDVDLVVTLAQGTTTSRTLQCIRDLTLVGSTTYLDDVAFCDGSSFNFLRQSMLVTNARGMAEFNNFTLGFGALGSYGFTVGLLSNPNIYVTTFLTVTANIQSIVVDSPLNALFMYNGEARFYIPIVNASVEEEVEKYGQDIEITVTFVPSARFTAYYYFDDATGAAEETAAYLGIPVSEYITSIAAEVEPLVPWICGAIIALDVQKNGEGSANAVIQPLTGPQQKGQQFINNMACTSEVKSGNFTLTGLGSKRQFSATLKFPKFAVTGSNTNQMFFGVSVMGLIIPLQVSDLASPTQVPEQLLVAATPLTNVSLVNATCSGCDASGWVVMEQEHIGGGTISVTVRGGLSRSDVLANKMVYLYALPSITNNSIALGSLANVAPTINPKTLLFEATTTNAQGVAVFKTAQFSVTGGPGVYDLYAVCDGVIANWTTTTAVVNASSSSNTVFHSSDTVRQIQVVTSVYEVVLAFSGNQSQIEYVGTPWEALPLFLILRNDGLGVPGKAVTITTAYGGRQTAAALGDGEVSSTSVALAANDDGVVLMISMVVHSINTSAWANYNASIPGSAEALAQDVEFTIKVDGNSYGKFTRKIAPPKNFTWIVAPPPPSSSVSTGSNDTSSSLVVNSSSERRSRQTQVTHQQESSRRRRGGGDRSHIKLSQKDIAERIVDWNAADDLLGVDRKQWVRNAREQIHRDNAKDKLQRNNSTYITPPHDETVRRPSLTIIPLPTKIEQTAIDDNPPERKRASQAAAADMNQVGNHVNSTNVTTDNDDDDDHPHGKCAFIHILSVSEQGYFGIPFYLYLIAVDALGNPVPNASVTLTVNPKYIPPQTGQTVFTQTFPANAQGILVCQINLNIVPLEFSILGNVFCTGAPISTATGNPVGYNPVVLDFVSRATSADIVSIETNKLCVKLNIRNPELITVQNPILVTVIPRWFPSYVANFLTPQLFPVADVISVTSPNDVNNVCISMSNSSVSTFPSGLYGFLISCDGNFMEPLVLSGLTTYPTHIGLRIIRSIFESPIDTSVRIGVVMPSQPIIQAFNATTTQPVSNITVFLQLAVIDPTTGTRKYQDYYSDTREIVMGGFAVLNTTASSTPTIAKPIGTPTDSNGYSYFSNVQLGGALPIVPFSVRYCISVNAQMTLDANSTENVCVDDPYVGVLPISQTLNFETSVSSISGSPGQPLPSLTITASLNDGGSPPGMICAPVLLNVPSAYLVFASNIFNVYDAYGTFRAIGNVLVITNGITLSPLTPEGNYVMVFYCSGGVTFPMPLIVSATPATIVILNAPPALSSPVSVNTIVYVSAKLLSQSATPVAFRDIEMTVQSYNPVVNCTGKACGYLDSSSILYTTTDVNGQAIFTIIFNAGNTSQYSLQMNVVDGVSSTAVRQASKNQLQSLANIYGYPIATLIPQIVKDLPQLSILLNVASGTAGVGTQQSGTLVAGGAARVPISPTSGGSSEGSGGGGNVAAALTYANPLESLVGLFKAAVQEASGGLLNSQALASSLAASVSANSEVALRNPVAMGTFLREGSLPSMELPQTAQEVAALSGISTTISVASTLDNNSSPIVQFLNADGSPVVNTSVNVEILPIGTSGCALSYNTTDFFTSADGSLALNGLTITGFTVGEYKLQISANGGGALQSQSFVITQATPISRTEYMKYLAIFLVCFFSPMLLASVPHTRRGYLPVACFVALCAMGVTVALKSLVPTDQPLYAAYFYFLVALTTVVALATVVMTLVETLATSGYGGFHFRICNDERRGEEVFQYATWITNVRIRKQASLWNEQQTKRAGSFGAKFQQFKYSTMRSAMTNVNSIAGSDVVDDSFVASKQAQSRRRMTQKALIYAPSESFDAVYPPINFLIVVGISSVLLVTLCFIIVYLYSFALQKINLFISYLPNTSGAEGGQLVIINKLLILAITTTVDIIVRMFPNFSRLSTINNAISDVDIVQILGTVREYVDEGILILQISFWIAGSVASIAFIVTIWLTWATIPNTIRQIRRGNQAVSSSVGSIEAYIGMHCLQLILMHQLVFWPLTIIIFLVSITGIRVFIWDKLSVIIVASIISYFSQTLIINLLVSRFLSDGRWLILRPELYSIWHFAGLILGIFSGLVKSAVRWGMSLGLVSALFARLDHAIYPALFASMDKGHTGFMSVVAIEAKTGNPIYLMFSTLLLLEARLRLEGEAVAKTLLAKAEIADDDPKNGGEDSEQPLIADVKKHTSASSPPSHTVSTATTTRHKFIVDDTLFRTNYDLSSVIKNVARLLLRRDAGCPTKLSVPPCNGSVMSGGNDKETALLNSDGATTSTTTASIDLTPFLCREDRVRKERVRQRFWLYVILSANPVLIPFRKHNIRMELEEEEQRRREAEETPVNDSLYADGYEITVAAQEV